jgi:4-amino-4-deoxy-L-arabinose transferase-like glycosyltransferase
MGRAHARPAIAGAAMCGTSVQRSTATAQLTANDLEALARRSSSAGVQNQAERRTVWLVLVVATVVAAALRFPFLDRQSLWFDEIFTRQILSEPSVSGLWHHIQATESTPPLYYLLGWLMHARSAMAMRAISAVALTAAVPVGYLAFRRFVGWRPALATAAVLAVNPMLVAYATDARSYGLLVFTALLSVWTFSVLIENPSRQRFALWVAASAGCVWTHYFGIFILVAEVAILLLAHPRTRAATAVWAGVLGVCLIPLAWLAASQAGDDRAEFIARIPLTTRASEAVRQFASGANAPRTWLEVAGVAIFCLSVGMGVALSFHLHRSSRNLLALAVVGFGVPLSMAALGLGDRFYSRNAIAVLPLAAALAARPMLRMRGALLTIYILLATVTSVWVATDWRYEQVDWRTALIRSRVLDPHATVIAVTRMGGSVVQTYLARKPTTSDVPARRAWIIVEPLRAAGERFLSPAPAPNLVGFTTLRSFVVESFRLVLVGADRPRWIVPRTLAGASVFRGEEG